MENAKTEQKALIPGDFEVGELGTTYQLPTFKVVKGKGLEHDGFHEISFVRGSKDPNEAIDGVTGVTHESLMEMMLEDLNYKKGLVPSRETACAITALEEARMWLQRRQDNRKKAGTQGTYQK